jgi:hypothetical protein
MAKKKVALFCGSGKNKKGEAPKGVVFGPIPGTEVLEIANGSETLENLSVAYVYVVIGFALLAQIATIRKKDPKVKQQEIDQSESFKYYKQLFFKQEGVALSFLMGLVVAYTLDRCRDASPEGLSQEIMSELDAYSPSFKKLAKITDKNYSQWRGGQVSSALGKLNSCAATNYKNILPTTGEKALLGLDVEGVIKLCGASGKVSKDQVLDLLDQVLGDRAADGLLFEEAPLPGESVLEMELASWAWTSILRTAQGSTPDQAANALGAFLVNN